MIARSSIFVSRIAHAPTLLRVREPLLRHRPRRPRRRVAPVTLLARRRAFDLWAGGSFFCRRDPFLSRRAVGLWFMLRYRAGVYIR